MLCKSSLATALEVARAQAGQASEDETPRSRSSLAAPSTSNEPSVVTWAPVQLEHEIIRAFDVASSHSEPLEFAFRRKELELRGLFQSLSVRDAHELHRRLMLLLADDPIAQRFTRLVGSRRARLLAFIGDARRREAQRAAR